MLRINNDNQLIESNKINQSKTGLILIGLTGGLGLSLSIICLPFVSPAFRKVCLPYVPATTQQVQNVLQGLKGRSGGTLIDLGSGDGRLVLAAAENNFTSYGVELNLWLVTYSRLLTFMKKLSPKATFYREDLWKHDLSKYDNVVLFGVQEMMEKIEEKFTKELKEDCLIIACRFPLPNLVPLKIIGSGIDTVWIYNKSQLRSITITQNLGRSDWVWRSNWVAVTGESPQNLIETIEEKFTKEVGDDCLIATRCFPLE